MKILLLGSSGLLGTVLNFYLNKNFNKIYTHSFRNKADFNIDLTNIDKTYYLIQNLKPDIIINCTGLTNVDDCERNNILAHKINSEIVLNIVKGCNNLKTWIIHFSTDHVYNDNIYNKEHNIKLTNVYSYSKFNGEKNLKQYNSLILRVNFFAIINKIFLKKETFSQWVLNSYKEKRSINLFKDVFFSPLLLDTLCLKLIEIIKKNYSISGTFNLGSISSISKENLAKKIILSVLKEELNNCNSVSVNKYLDVIRPNFMQMNSEKIIKSTGISLPTIDEEIQKLSRYFNS